jgi:hypothetical protein
MLIGLSHGWVAAQTLNLGRLIQLAIETHPSVRAQLSNEKSAQSGIETAQYQRYPTPQLSYESVKKNSADPSYIGSDGVATVRITQPIFTGGQFTAQLDKAKAKFNLAKPAFVKRAGKLHSKWCKPIPIGAAQNSKCNLLEKVWLSIKNFYSKLKIALRKGSPPKVTSRSCKADLMQPQENFFQPSCKPNWPFTN